MTVDLENIRSVITQIAPEYGIGKAYVFGSYARSEQDDASDVDIVIELDRPLGFKRGRLCLEIESMLGLPIDLVFGRDQLHPPIRKEFDCEAVLIYES